MVRPCFGWGQTRMRCSSLPHRKHLGFSRGGRLVWVTLAPPFLVQVHRRPWALDVSMGTGVLFIHGGAFVELIGLVGVWAAGRGVVWNDSGLPVLGRLQFRFCVC